MHKVNLPLSHYHLVRAKNTKNDEYYTLLPSIELEVAYYQSSLRGKTVYCNCDGLSSNFVLYFVLNFHELGLDRLIVSGIGGYYLDYDGATMKKGRIDGDFRSEECRKLLLQADIVITNPPFSQFPAFIGLLIRTGVDFLIIGPKTAISYMEVFPHIASGRIHLGHTIPNEFTTPKGEAVMLPNLCRWFTTLPSKTPKPIRMFTTPYTEGLYQQFDHYPAINVDRTKDIPCDYNGLMGVPITALEGLDTSSYEIVDLIARYAVIDHNHDVKGHQLTEIHGEPKFSRLIIRKRLSAQQSKAA